MFPFIFSLNKYFQTNPNPSDFKQNSNFVLKDTSKLVRRYDLHPCASTPQTRTPRCPFHPEIHGLSKESPSAYEAQAPS